MKSASSNIIGLYQPYPHTFGGAQSVVLKLAHGLPERGFEPRVIVPESGRFTELLEREQVPFWVSDPGPVWHVYGRGARGLSYLLSPGRAIALVRYWFKLAKELRERQIAVLHCNDYRGVMMAAPAARLARVPVLWHMHGFLPSTMANLIAARLAQRTVPVSSGMLGYLNVRRWLMGRAQVIHNGVEESSRPAPEADMQTRPVVLAAGTLHPRKGYETLIEAFAQVVAAQPEAECWIAGPDFADGSYTRKLQERIDQLQLSDRVRLLGARSDVAALMAGCQLLCVPSRIEPFGLVAVEAMLASKPVVASRTGGLPEIVVHGETGLLVEPGNPGALAEVILAIVQDGPLAERMGRAGQARARGLFSVARMIEAFAGLYQGLLEGTSAKSQPEWAQPGKGPFQPAGQRAWRANFERR